jgi:GNAT superfamily N-acetyltransferase
VVASDQAERRIAGGLKLIYDMFWGMYGGNAEWLYVRPKYRGSGLAVAILAEICARVREAGGEFLRGGGEDEAERLYERVAIGRPTHECYVSAEAFQRLADSAGRAPREIVRRLPRVELNRVAARPRTSIGAIRRFDPPNHR